ncbi:putative ribosomal protein S11 [Helianthus annuus]|uniref:Ribosomal protein S11 n=1 Tax=Helianthus annuus TaxID=4232 RepID=A0A251S1A2_HELAN|nr:putative ribosomal protein S11 [Helianthus annuus]KAJ0820063.1 putative ribosomal protein S11 [Helianthus annuus]
MFIHYIQVSNAHVRKNMEDDFMERRWLMGWHSHKTKRNVREPKEDNVTLGPATCEGNIVFDVAHIFESFSDTFIVSLILFYRNSTYLIGHFYHI